MPPREYLLYRFRYDREAGTLTRRNGRSAYAIHSAGYYSVMCEGVQFLAHRVIWKMETGEEPAEVDHRDGDRVNNRWANLRSDDGTGNRRNKKLTAQNTSGLKGASFVPRVGKWRATIKADGKWHWLGYFDTKEAAHAAYIDAAKKLHGDFANDGRGAV